MTGFLAVFLFISISTFAAARIEDFIVESENDLRRSSEVSLGEEYDSDDELMVYDGCANSAAAAEHFDIYDFFGGIGQAESDAVSAADEAAISLQSVMQNGQINEQLLQRAIRKLSNDPRFAAILEHAHLHDGIPSDMQVQDSSGCQSLDFGVDMFYNTEMI